MANANDARDPLPSDLPASAPALNDVEAGAHDGAGSPTPSQTVVDRKNKKGGLTEGDDMLDDLPDNNLMLVMPCLALVLSSRRGPDREIIIATALPTIAEVFDATPSEYSWVATAYQLAMTLLTPVNGRVSDIVGRKTSALCAIIIFTIFSALCGCAKSMTWLITARAFQGLGGGSIIGLTSIVVSDIVPLHKRGKYQGFMGAAWGIAAVVGPILGGVLTRRFRGDGVSTSTPTCGVAFILLVVTLKLNKPTGGTFRQLAHTFDFIGLSSSWSLRAFKVRTTLFFLIGSSLHAAWHIVRPIPWSGYVVAIIGYGVMYGTFNYDLTLAMQYGLLIIPAVGVGFSLQTPLVILQRAMPLKEMASVAGGSVGVSIFTAILNTNIRSRFAKIPGYGTEFTAPTSSAGYKAIHDLPAGDMRNSVLAAFADSFKPCWLVSLALFAAALLITLRRARTRSTVPANEAASEEAETEEEEAVRAEAEKAAAYGGGSESAVSELHTLAKTLTNTSSRRGTEAGEPVLEKEKRVSGDDEHGNNAARETSEKA
ncbi:uncharacterized protein EHS24_003295 [Apiotrichum porosum]|uniref:Major facilitator superfamily (MFS) profile domain-containing protein n=1 Tax=Apiotrichum porosum TaxID=105984 RepID=A0A427XES6_9TREE|nr:uncharacterized protein EHS24_003295 [Apiotrichum porosum]RSH77336.1 hypothetical protein EHS24_003295 [Apiotrichum porosum]